jgi:hypothetical protein
MRIAIDDLKLDALYVVYPGEHRFGMGDGIEAVPVWGMLVVRRPVTSDLMPEFARRR